MTERPQLIGLSRKLNKRRETVSATLLEAQTFLVEEVKPFICAKVKISGEPSVNTENLWYCERDGMWGFYAQECWNIAVAVAPTWTAIKDAREPLKIAACEALPALFEALAKAMRSQIEEITSIGERRDHGE